MSSYRNNACLYYLSVYQPPIFTLTPDPVEVTEGDDLVLACKAEGRPVPEISWYLGDELLSEDGQHVAIAEQQQGHECSSNVSLRNLLPTLHAGKYTMEAANSVGTVRHTVIISGEICSLL